MPTSKQVTNFVINKVPTKAIFNKMKEQGLINDDEIYIVEEDDSFDYVPLSGGTMTGTLSTPKLNMKGNIVFQDSNQTSENSIRFYSKLDGSKRKHAIQIYGGDPNSDTGIGIFDANKSWSVLKYSSSSNTTYSDANWQFQNSIKCLSSNEERQIIFENTSGSHTHKCSLYGADGNTTTGIGIHDNKNNRTILHYNDVTNKLVSDIDFSCSGNLHSSGIYIDRITTDKNSDHPIAFIDSSGKIIRTDLTKSSITNIKENITSKKHISVSINSSVPVSSLASSCFYLNSLALGFIRIYCKTTGTLNAGTIYNIANLSSDGPTSITALSCHCSKYSEGWLASGNKINFRPYQNISSGYDIVLTGVWTK